MIGKEEKDVMASNPRNVWHQELGKQARVSQPIGVVEIVALGRLVIFHRTDIS